MEQYTAAAVARGGVPRGQRKPGQTYGSLCVFFNDPWVTLCERDSAVGAAV